MTLEDLHEAFDAQDGEYLKFDRIESPRHPCPDVCAFLMLYDLVPIKDDMVSAAAHDTIFLATDLEALAAKVTPDDIRDLTRCGVMLDKSLDCLFMFA